MKISNIRFLNYINIILEWEKLLFIIHFDLLDIIGIKLRD